MTDSNQKDNWKLRLRFGKLETEFSPFVLFAKGRVVDSEAAGCRKGPAIMTVRAWAKNDEEAFDISKWVCGKVGFEISGKIDLHEDNDPKEPPRDRPSAYGVTFTPYSDGD